MVLSAANRVRAVLMQVAAVLVMLLFVWEIQAAEVNESAANSTWVTLNGCKFLSEDYDDGDSFHVKYGQREFIFRFYFVDTPEVEATYADRIREQCDYFGVTRVQHLKTGVAARALTAELLQRPFVVTTRWQNAMGRSRLPRYYALIEVGGEDMAACWCAAVLRAPRERSQFCPPARKQRLTWRS